MRTYDNHDVLSCLMFPFQKFASFLVLGAKSSQNEDSVLKKYQARNFSLISRPNFKLSFKLPTQDADLSASLHS